MNILITGGAGGIGEAIAKAFAEKGYNLALQYNKSENKASEIKNELEKTYGIKALTIKADLTKNEEIEALAKKALSEFGTVDVLINNAGIAHQELFQLCSDEKAKEILSKLKKYKMVYSTQIEMDDEIQTVYHFRPTPSFVAFLIFAILSQPISQ